MYSTGNYFGTIWMHISWYDNIHVTNKQNALVYPCYVNVDTVWMPHWPDWLTNCPQTCQSDWLTDRPTNCLMVCMKVCLTDVLFDWETCRWMNWLTDRLTDGWTDWLSACLLDWLFDWMSNCLSFPLTDQQTDALPTYLNLWLHMFQLCPFD